MRERIDLFRFSLVRTLKLRTENFTILEKEVEVIVKKKNENINMRGFDKWFWAEHNYWTHFAVTEGITVYPVASEISVKWAMNSCV